ncbi:MAG: phosphoglucomutase/phosphomannomutase alpha/beta/alpha domain [Acidobacteriales bacterium]|nr:phosphoglucomutase/phosphomannomutase alpha/beta/alpha domain [Terriglobales bacterium]
MDAQIKFGTSGWRAIVADEFTLHNVRRAVTGIARYVASKNPNGRVIVGRDPRYMGETLVNLAAEVLIRHGITPLVIEDAAPTPAISYEITRLAADGAINFTASHNPPEYNGIKFNSSDGAPALPEVTKAIEAEIIRADSEPASPSSSNVKSEIIDVKPPYLAKLRDAVNLSVIAKSGLKVVFDPLWGAGRGYSDALLRDAGVPVTAVHDVRDVLFGGHAPEAEDHLLDEARQQMRSTGARIAIATDGDADRFGIVDADGTFLQPNYVIALLFDYLVETRGWRNGVAKSVATTNMINALADFHNIELHETPVGFKYIGELIKADKIAIGGEESAGLSIRHHVPEKDGIIAGLLCCEMVARRGKSLGEQLRDLFGKVGSFYPLRQNFRLTPEVKEKFTTKLASEPRDFSGRKVQNIVRTDGLKLIFDDGSWVLYRLSGTEPVVRVYTESRSMEDSSHLSTTAKNWIFQ